MTASGGELVAAVVVVKALSAVVAGVKRGFCLPALSMARGVADFDSTGPALLVLRIGVSLRNAGAAAAAAAAAFAAATRAATVFPEVFASFVTSAFATGVVILAIAPDVDIAAGDSDVARPSESAVAIKR